MRTTTRSTNMFSLVRCLPWHVAPGCRNSGALEAKVDWRETETTTFAATPPSSAPLDDMEKEKEALPSPDRHSLGGEEKLAIKSFRFSVAAFLLVALVGLLEMSDSIPRLPRERWFMHFASPKDAKARYNL